VLQAQPCRGIVGRFFVQDCWDCFAAAKAALVIYVFATWRREGVKMGPGRRGPGRAFPDGIAEDWAQRDSVLVHWLKHLADGQDPAAHLQNRIDWAAIGRFGGSPAFRRLMCEAASASLPSEYRPYDRVKEGPGPADARRFVAALTGLAPSQLRELAKGTTSKRAEGAPTYSPSMLCSVP